MRTTGAPLLTAAVVFSVGCAVASAAVAPKVVRQTATGRITALGLAEIGVGKTSCQLRGRLIESEAQEFAVGERVTISCVRGQLKTIALAPTTGPAVSLPPLISGVSTVPCASTSGTFSAGTSGVSTSSTTCNGATTTSTDAIGTITSLVSPDGCPTASVEDCASITVGTLTCSIDPSLYALIAPKYATGDQASIACLNGKLSAIGA